MALLATSSSEVLTSTGLPQMTQVYSVWEERAIPYLGEEVCSVMGKSIGRTAIMGLFSWIELPLELRGTVAGNCQK